MPKSIFQTLILSILLISCKEKAETFKLNVKGKVVDYYTGEGIANATIYVKDIKNEPSKEQIVCLDEYCISSSKTKIKSDISENFNESFWLK